MSSSARSTDPLPEPLMPVMMTSSEEDTGRVSRLLGFSRSAFRPTFAIAPFSLQADCLRFQLTRCHMDRGEEVLIRTLPHQLMVLKMRRSFRAVQMALLGEHNANSQFAFFCVE